MSDKLAGGIKAGSTDVSLIIMLRSSTDNTAVTDKSYSDFNVSYWRQGGTRTAVTEATLATVDAAHSDGGIIEVDSTNMPGLYRLDLPDAAVSSGADWVVISAVVSGAYVFVERYALESTNSTSIATSIAALNDISTSDVNIQCATALTTYDPPTKAELDAGLAGLNDIAAADVWSVATRALTDKAGFTISGSKTTLDDLNDLSAADVNAQCDTALSDYDAPTKVELDSGLAGLNDPTAAMIADAVWDEAISGHTGAGTFGAKNQKVVPSESANDYKADVSALATAAALATVDSNVDAILVDTGTTLPSNLSTMEGKIDTVDSNVDAILTDTGTDGVELTTSAVDAILDEVVEGTMTLRQMLRVMLAALAGKSTGGGTATITFQDVGDTKARITATVDSSGNRTSITTDGT